MEVKTKKMTTFISNFLEPDQEKWIQLPGVLIDVSDSLEAAERALKKRDGTSTTDNEMNTMKSSNALRSAWPANSAEIDKEEVENLISLGHANSGMYFFIYIVFIIACSSRRVR